MKKSLSIILLAVILINFIFLNCAYADSGEAAITAEDSTGSATSALNGVKLDGEDGNAISKDTLYNLAYNGVTAGIGMNFNLLGNIFEVIAGILAMVLDLFPMLMQLIMSLVSGIMTSKFKLFTIEQVVFNEAPNFSINYFDLSADTSTLSVLKTSVAKYYYILRLIAIALSLLTLIYVGIRMALSTVASDKTKYKKMLMAWFESIIILFSLHYIIGFFFYLSSIFNDILQSFRTSLGGTSFEETIINNIYSIMVVTSGWSYVVYSVIFWILIFIQTKFFLMYFRRTIVVGFLILISPLITIIYPIDKVGDGKAQSFSVWLTEFMMNVFIQPIHAIIYLIFMYSAGEIAKYSVLVAAVFLWFLTKVDKMILHLFNLRNVMSLRPVDEERKK